MHCPLFCSVLILDYLLRLPELLRACWWMVEVWLA
ncbi:hypothetical protein COLO4_36595 [Corchorus olitorius]|uniref:Uncharacterized protein n=1 Tax=Corchorus olitorius TaxID=93759 RepID=A0A1R3G7M0_9ROSI|nr:hypothetical protein COLO4_36595 [Corchorus olitorius]